MSLDWGVIGGIIGGVIFGITAIVFVVLWIIGTCRKYMGSRGIVQGAQVPLTITDAL